MEDIAAESFNELSRMLPSDQKDSDYGPTDLPQSDNMVIEIAIGWESGVIPICTSFANTR